MSNNESETNDLIDMERRNLLKEKFQATNDELKYLEKLIVIQKSQINSNGQSRIHPSLIIDEFLYLGDLGHAIDINLLLDLSIKNILNVCDCPLDSELTSIINVNWIHNLQDNLQANIRQYFDQTNHFLIQCKERNERVLVHCQAGISRSSSIVLAYLIKYRYSTLEEAYQYLLDRRPIISPNYGFLLQLIRYEKEIHHSTENQSYSTV